MENNGTTCKQKTTEVPFTKENFKRLYKPTTFYNGFTEENLKNKGNSFYMTTYGTLINLGKKIIVLLLKL